jgi:hypothetical protein
MKVFIVESHGRPFPFATLDAAKAFAEDDRNVTPDENPQWLQVGDQHRSAVRWRSQLVVVWECEVGD